jgi:sugar lactone lactonase YvrE
MIANKLLKGYRLTILREAGLVVHQKNAKIKLFYKITIGLALVTLISFSMNSELVCAQSYDFVTEWGSFGSSDGQFNGPGCIAVDNTGYVYIVDFCHYRIEKFTDEGTFVMTWGSFGSEEGQFNQISGLAVDDEGNVYVNDQTTYSIQKFTSDGVFIKKWGNTGSGKGEFKGHNGLAVEGGYVYMTDPNGFQIKKFTTNGTFVKAWGTFGSDKGQFNYPNGIAVDNNGYVYVTDIGNYRVQKFTGDGDFVTKWGNYGSGDGQFKAPIDIAVDDKGNVYVTDPNNNRVERFTSDGVFVAVWGSYGSEEGQFSSPIGVAADSKGYVYVTDPNNARAEKFVPSSALLSSASPLNITLIVGVLLTIVIAVIIVLLLVRIRQNKKRNFAGSHIFISHAKEDAGVALKIAEILEQTGYKSWYYERDNCPDCLNNSLINMAVAQSQVVILMISPNSLRDCQITSEVIHAHDSGKPFIPVLLGVSHADFQQRQPEWREAIGAATSITIPPQGVETIMPRIMRGLELVGAKKQKTRNKQSEIK